MSNDNTLRDYLISIGRFNVLTKEEEQAYAREMRDADPTKVAAAREALINHNLKLVVSIAKNYRNARLSLMDLIAEGNLGLIAAVDRFNPDLDYRFSTCATPWIKQSILKAITDQGRAMRLPANVFQLMSKYKAVIADFQSRGISPITDAMIAEALDISEAKVNLLRSVKHDALSLSMPLGDEADGDTLEDLVTSYDETPAEAAERSFARTAIMEAIHRLKPRTQTIIKLRYGLAEPGDPSEYAEPHTLEEIGTYMDLTRERIRQIEKEALVELRPYLEALV